MSKPNGTPNVLDIANSLIHGDRTKAYGHPLDDYNCTAAIWNAMIERRRIATGSVEIDAGFACLMMAAMKLSRQAGGHKDDNLVDGAGYLGCIERIKDELSRREGDAVFAQEQKQI